MKKSQKNSDEMKKKDIQKEEKTDIKKKSRQKN